MTRNTIEGLKIIGWQWLIMFAFVLILVVVTFIGWGFRGSTDSDFTNWIENTKQHYRASDIKAALIPLVSTFDYKEGQNNDVPINQLPKEITQLSRYAHPEATDIAGGGKREDRTIFVTWGGGFGHWGIIVAPLGGRAMTNGLYGKVIPWEGEVYFFRSQ
jgi:hypothetical protein